MNTTQKIISFFLLLIAGVWVIFAANTIIHRIPGWQNSTWPSPYPSQNTITLDDNTSTLANEGLLLINKDNDSVRVWDYLQGYYYDAAYGVFKIEETSTDRVQITSATWGSCASGKTGYRMDWFAYNQDFWFVDFWYDSSRYVYICIPNDPTDTTLSTDFGWYAYSQYTWFQNFNGIVSDVLVTIDDADSEWRFVKVEGVVSSSTEVASELTDQFSSDVRVIWKLTKASFRKDLQENVFKVITSLSPQLTAGTAISSAQLSATQWSAITGTSRVLDNKALYAWFNGTVSNPNVTLNGTTTLSWNKTLVVEWWNVYITWNIRGTGMLWIIALQKNGQWGNIYINPSVTDIHAVLYADRALLSYNGTSELDGSTPASQLANQIYIYGSLFSENTIGWSSSASPICPFYVSQASCDVNTAKKYDLNYLRKYILVQPTDAGWLPVGPKQPQYGAAESYMGDSSNTNTPTTKPANQKYPFIIEYNPLIQQTPPPFFN
jgi:hypothetical protein